MPTPETTLVHATAVAVGGRGVLILGASGAGKSDLALRVITTPHVRDGAPVAARLVADDQVVIERDGDRLFASPPASIAGKLEVRGLGKVELPHEPRDELRLAVALRPAEQIERMPDGLEIHPILGVKLPLVAIDGSKPGATGRLLLAVLGSVP